MIAIIIINSYYYLSPSPEGGSEKEDPEPG